jgi:hypothetical protein
MGEERDRGPSLQERGVYLRRRTKTNANFRESLATQIAVGYAGNTMDGGRGALVSATTGQSAEQIHCRKEEMLYFGFYEHYSIS